jgi:translation initiation factor 2B subunit (eIF-2B alpha/beta/delta family)
MIISQRMPRITFTLSKGAAPASQRLLSDPSISHSEIILTLGMSKTVEQFLKSAAHSHNYSVIIAETAPSFVSLSMLDI